MQQRAWAVIQEMSFCGNHIWREKGPLFNTLQFSQGEAYVGECGREMIRRVLVQAFQGTFVYRFAHQGAAFLST